MLSASLIRTLATVTVFLSILPAINRTTNNAYGFSFDHPAPYSPSMSSDRVVVPSTNRVVGIHRPVPQQLQDQQQQQQQQQRPMMIADSVLLQTLLDYTEQQNDDVLNSPPRPRTTLMTMTESTSHQMGEELMLSGKTTDLTNWYSSCLSDDRFDAADCKIILIEQCKLLISRENDGISREKNEILRETNRETNGVALVGIIAAFTTMNKKQDTLPAANEGKKLFQQLKRYFQRDKQP